MKAGFLSSIRKSLFHALHPPSPELKSFFLLLTAMGFTIHSTWMIKVKITEAQRVPSNDYL
jgi:hypothetical protein